MSLSRTCKIIHVGRDSTNRTISLIWSENIGDVSLKFMFKNITYDNPIKELSEPVNMKTNQDLVVDNKRLRTEKTCWCWYNKTDNGER